jgi:opacity protein-like surface antigen
MSYRATVTRATATVLVLLTGAVMHPSDTRANDDETSARHWGTLRLHGVLGIPVGQNEVEAWNQCDDIAFLSFLDFYSALEVNTAGGVVAGFEYVFKRRIGVELSFMYLANVVEMEFTATAADLSITGAPNFTFPLLGANYHFTPGRTADVYAGGLVALGVIAMGFPADEIEIAKDFALGINAGMDYYLDKSWSLGANLKYMDFGEVDFSVYPPGFDGFICNNGAVGLGQLRFVTIALGVGYRFL